MKISMINSKTTCGFYLMTILFFSNSIGNAQKILSRYPIIYSQFSDVRYFDWGKRPIQPEDGPGENWTSSSMMCMGPTQVVASSELANQGKFNYKANNISDDDPTTAWVEGNNDYGIGEFLEFQDWFVFGYREVYILNGYQSSKTAWENNSRVKEIEISFNGKILCSVILGDVMGLQTFVLTTDIIKFIESNNEIEGSSKTVKFTIIDVYPGLKWKDTAISEIYTCGG